MLATSVINVGVRTDRGTWLCMRSASQKSDQAPPHSDSLTVVLYPPKSDQHTISQAHHSATVTKTTVDICTGESERNETAQRGVAQYISTLQL